VKLSKVLFISHRKLHILRGVYLGGGAKVLENNEPVVDLDDLIFGEGDGLPSER